MSKIFLSLLSLVVITVMAGCSQPTTTIPAEGGDSGHMEKKESADIAVPAPAEAPAAPAEAPAAPAAPAEAPAAPAAPAPSASAAPLTGSTWA